MTAACDRCGFVRGLGLLYPYRLCRQCVRIGDFIAHRNRAWARANPDKVTKQEDDA